MATISTSDGQAFSTPYTYAELRALLFEGKNTALPTGVTLGPGNPPQWVEVAVGPGPVPTGTTPITITRANIVTLTP